MLLFRKNLNSEEEIKILSCGGIFKVSGWGDDIGLVSEIDRE